MCLGTFIASEPFKMVASHEKSGWLLRNLVSVTHLIGIWYIMWFGIMVT